MIDAKIAELEEKRRQAPAEDIPKENERVGLNEIGAFDTDIYTGGKSKFEGYHTTLAIDDADEEDDLGGGAQPQKRASFTAPLALLNDVVQGQDDYDPFAEHKRPKIADREDEYRRRRRDQIISPARVDPFANGGATPDIGSRGYTQIMREQALRAEEVIVDLLVYSHFWLQKCMVLVCIKNVAWNRGTPLNQRPIRRAVDFRSA